MSSLYAQSATATGGTIGALLPFVLMFVIIYFLIIRPQRKKQKSHKNMLENLKVGDEVITNGGIKGVIANLKQNKGIISLKIADNVKIEILRSAISTIIINKQKEIKQETKSKPNKKTAKKQDVKS